MPASKKSNTKKSDTDQTSTTNLNPTEWEDKTAKSSPSSVVKKITVRKKKENTTISQDNEIYVSSKPISDETISDNNTLSDNTINPTDINSKSVTENLSQWAEYNSTANDYINVDPNIHQSINIMSETNSIWSPTDIPKYQDQSWDWKDWWDDIIDFQSSVTENQTIDSSNSHKWESSKDQDIDNQNTQTIINQDNTKIQQPLDNHISAVISQTDTNHQIPTLDPFYQIKWSSSDSQHKPVDIDTIINQTINPTNQINTIHEDPSIWPQQGNIQESKTETNNIIWSSPSANQDSINHSIHQLTKQKTTSIIGVMFAGIGFLALLGWGWLVYNMMFPSSVTNTVSISSSGQSIDAQFISWDEESSTWILDIPIFDTNWEDTWWFDNTGNRDNISSTQSGDSTTNETENQKDDDPDMQAKKSGQNNQEWNSIVSQTNNKSINYLDKFEQMLAEAESGYQYTDLKGYTKANRLYKIIKLKLQQIVTNLQNWEVITSEILQTDLEKYSKYIQKAQNITQ